MCLDLGTSICKESFCFTTMFKARCCLIKGLYFNDEVAQAHNLAAQLRPVSKGLANVQFLDPFHNALTSRKLCLLPRSLSPLLSFASQNVCNLQRTFFAKGGHKLLPSVDHFSNIALNLSCVVACSKFGLLRKLRIFWI